MTNRPKTHKLLLHMAETPEPSQTTPVPKQPLVRLSPAHLIEAIKPLSADRIQAYLGEYDEHSRHRDAELASYGDNADLVPREPQTDLNPTPANTPEYLGLLNRCFKDEFKTTSYSLADLSPYRVRAAWRILRHMLRCWTLLEPDQTLEDAVPPKAITPSQDRWRVPQAPLGEFYDDKQLSYLETTILKAAHKIPSELCVWRFNQITKEPRFFEGMPILPPPVPWGFSESNPDHDPDYDPLKDRLLVLYCRLIDNIATDLMIRVGTRIDREAGRMGMAGLTDPRLVRLAFPSRYEIINFENQLIRQTAARVIDHSQFEVLDWLGAQHGLNSDESQAMLKMARTVIRKTHEADIEDDRGLMIARLEDVARRAREAMDIRAEIAALKQMSIVLRLGDGEKDPTMAMFTQIIQTVDKERSGRFVDATPVKRLP